MKKHVERSASGRARSAGASRSARSLPLAAAGNRALAQRLAVQRDRASDLAACQSVLMAADPDTDALHPVRDFTVVDTSDRLTLIRKVHGNTWVSPNDEAVLVRICAAQAWTPSPPTTRRSTRRAGVAGPSCRRPSRRSAPSPTRSART